MAEAEAIATPLEGRLIFGTAMARSQHSAVRNGAAGMRPAGSPRQRICNSLIHIN
jgi:ribosomal protein S3